MIQPYAFLKFVKLHVNGTSPPRGQNRYESTQDAITHNSAAVATKQKFVTRGSNSAKYIMAQFEKSKPSKPKFSERTWQKILTHENLDLDCLGGAPS